MTDIDNSTSTIRAIVADVLELNPDEIDDAEDFVDQYQADSLNLIEIVAQLEKQYQVILPQRELLQAHTVAALRDVVRRHTA
ncbi:acyl carrier protein [Paractinoplanes lichenicola]|uniref:Acyl carrier protein n=1 Tax=Paractinoplanes lichenicola TaxID=2802976 RepID=A0ABS1VFC2_9ACTN|nr:acyl carrier protein [Actinoplanes lichenicola]MBL7253397.1 acyl carrier protein [Actinoplanes lichenicola]